MKRYLLPCDCGARIPLTAGLAGETVRCPTCHAQLAVPRLGGLEALEQALAEPVPRRQWTAGQGLGFSGLLVAAASLMGVFALQFWAQPPLPVAEADIRAAVAASDIGTVHRAYRDLARSGVHRPPLPEEARLQRRSRTAEMVSWLLWPMAACGAAIAAMGLGFGRGRSYRVVDEG